MIDQAERLRELEREVETLTDRLDVMNAVHRENDVLRQAFENIETILMFAKGSPRKAVNEEVRTTRQKLDVLEES